MNPIFRGGRRTIYPVGPESRVKEHRQDSVLSYLRFFTLSSANITLSLTLVNPNRQFNVKSGAMWKNLLTWWAQNWMDPIDTFLLPCSLLRRHESLYTWDYCFHCKLYIFTDFDCSSHCQSVKTMVVNKFLISFSSTATNITYIWTLSNFMF